MCVQVTLTRVPEYVNFWQGKPLSKRECALPVHSRTAWKRPKSDYGSRITVPKNGNALATVMEGVDGDWLADSTSKDHSAAEKVILTYIYISI